MRSDWEGISLRLFLPRGYCGVIFAARQRFTSIGPLGGQWKCMEEVPRRTSLVPLAFLCFVLCLMGVETEGLLAHQGRAGDHFHCTVEPSPGHIRC